jgi:hypothetical protein
VSHHVTCQHERYRLTCSDYDELWLHAGGSCELCGTPASETPDAKLFIDHAQPYGFFAVRGLLCSKCNSLMGYIDRGEKQDTRAIGYLANAWFVRVLHQRHVGNVAARRRLRRDGAGLPERPASSEGTSDGV